MVTIIEEAEIIKVVGELDLASKMKQGFIEYSNGNAVIPPVGELLFDEPKGEAHIKYGYIQKTDFYTIKVASGFYENPKLGISSSQGLVLLFSQKTGELVAVLLDNGKLTDLRTAAAGQLVASFFASKEVHGIGIIGTGIQAKLQLQFLLKGTSCLNIWVWGRNEAHANEFKRSVDGLARIQIAKTPAEVASHTNLIVTTTPSEQPLLFAKDINPGTHITAVGSDTGSKQELSSDLLGKADLLIVDSLEQAKTRGEVFRAVSQGGIIPQEVIELGKALRNPQDQRITDQQITIADLTGVAVQDIMIAEAVFRRYQEK